MRRKNWVSLVCGGLLLVAAALPAAAAGAAPRPRPALLAWVVDWIAMSGWSPGVQAPSPVESKAAAGKPQNDVPLPAESACELCNEGEISSVADPDG